MPRPQSAEYPLRREAIVEQAAELFAARGFLGASMADLAAACGASKSLLYHYFPAKEDILYEIMRSHLEALEAAAAGAGGGDRLTALFAAWLALYAGARARHVVLLNGLCFLPEARRAEIVARQRGLIAELEAALLEVRPDWAGEPPRLRAAAMLAFGMINWTHTWYRAEGPLDPQALAELAAAMVLEGVRRA